MREYGVVYSSFWTDPETQVLSDGAQMLFLYLLTGPHTEPSGCFRLPFQYVAADRKTDVETVSKWFTELFSKQLVYHCPNTDWVLIPKFLKRNPIKNPNCGKQIAAKLHLVPKHFSYMPELIDSLNRYANHLPNGFVNSLVNGLPNIDQNQNQNQNQNKILSASDDAAAAKGAPPFYLTKKGKKLTGKRLETFEQFWEAFNWKKGKAEAAEEWLKLPPMHNGDFEKILTAAKTEASNRAELIKSGCTPKWAQGWLSGRRWEDEQTGIRGTCDKYDF